MTNSTSSVGSGINIKELVTQLVDAESKDKKIKYDKDEALALAKVTAFGSLKTKLTQFEEALFDWRESDPFQQKGVTATTFNGNNVVSGTATAKASSGNYSIEVTQLAKSLKCGTKTTFSTMATVVGTGTLTFTMGTASTSFNIDNSNNTVQGIVNTVNADSASTGITASVIANNTGAIMVFSSNQTGDNYNFTISATDDGDGDDTDNAGLSQLASPNLNTLQASQNAMVNIDGVAVVSDSNTIDTSIQGVTLKLLTTNIGNPVTLSIANDVKGAYKSISNFVEKCNSIFSMISELTAYGGDQGGKSGVLIGDATLRNLEFQLRRMISNLTSTLPSGFSSLSQIGITTDEFSGQMKINTTQLTCALENNFQAVGTLFLDKNVGVVNKMSSVIDNYADSTGILQSKVNGFKKNIDVINEQRVNLERHLTHLQSRLLSQFIAMDKYVARLKSLSDFLTTQLENLPKPNSTR